MMATEYPPISLSRAAAFLQSAAATLRGEAGTLGDEGMRWHRADGEWCFNEVLGHLIEAERRGFAGQIRRIIDGTPLPSWDQEEVASERRDCDKGGLALLAEFESERADSVRLVHSLREDQFSLSGEHPLVGELRIIDLLHEWQHHDRTHVMQAMDVVRAMVWPHMGNAQRFSDLS